VIDDPALSKKVTEVLQHPVAAERPSLLHFTTAKPGRVRTATTAKGGGGLGAWSVIALVAVLLLVTGLLVALLVIRRTSRKTLGMASSSNAGLWMSLARSWMPSMPRRAGPAVEKAQRRTPTSSHKLPGPAIPAAWVRRASSHRPQLRTRSRRIAAVGLLLPAAVIVAGFAVSAGTRSGVPPSPRPVSPNRTVTPSVANPGVLPGQVAQAALASGWNQLLTIEQSLEKQRGDIAVQEAGVKRLSGALQTEPPNSARAPQLQAQLQQLVTSHEVAVSGYDKLLQSEYEFFQGAVHSPPVRHSLVAVAAAAGPPDALPAVKYDLDLVEAQTNQEAALGAAEAAAPVVDSVTALLRSVGRPKLISPMGGAIEQGFGPSSLSFEPPVSRNGHFFEHFHTGIDISAPEGTAVHAAAAGRVILAASSTGDGGQLVGYGRYVAISHGNGFTTVYGHLDSINVKVGQQVDQGTVIGHEGSTGNSTGPHLHFETRVNGSAVDPAPYLKGVLHLR